jgi:hypothetical protein
MRASPHLGRLRQQAACLAADADEADVDPVIGARTPRSRQHTLGDEGGQGDAGRGQQAALQKIPAGEGELVAHNQ